MTAFLHINSLGECLLGGHLLHPAEDPLRAARADLKQALPAKGDGGRLVLVGAGLGWHAQAAAQVGWRVAVLEPDAQKQAMAAALGPELNQVTYLDNVNQLHELLAAEEVYARGGGVEVFAPEAVGQADRELEAQVREAVAQALSRAEMDRATRVQKASLWLHNLEANFKHVVNVCDVTHLARRFAGTPALVVGAGPSLDASLETLGRVGDRALILAAASALGPLGRAEIVPHAAVALEGKDESRQFQGGDMDRTVLLAASTGHPNHFTSWAGAKAIFHLLPWVAHVAHAPAALANGGHATSAAFALAVLWGCDPVVLVGQDLAYTGGKIHASGRPGGEDELRPERVTTPAIGGGQAETSPVMQSYINWYQEAASYLRRRQPPVRVINATHAGAKLQGFEHMALDEASRLMDGGPIYPLKLRNALASVPCPRAATVAHSCMAARVELRKVLHILEQDGAQQAMETLVPGSPAEWACEGWEPGRGSEDLRQRLEGLSSALMRMAEGVHG